MRRLSNPQPCVAVKRHAQCVYGRRRFTFVKLLFTRFTIESCYIVMVYTGLLRSPKYRSRMGNKANAWIRANTMSAAHMRK